MNNEQSRTKIFEKISVDYQIFKDEDIEKKVDAIIEDTPSTLRETYGEGKYNQALGVYDVYRKNHPTGEGKGDADPTGVQENKKDQSKPKYKADNKYTATVEIAADVLQRIKEEVYTEEDFNKMCAEGKGIHILKLIRKRPSLQQLVKDKLLQKTVTVDEKLLAKVKKTITGSETGDVTAKLVNTTDIPNSAANFKKFEEACKASSTVDIYITDSMTAPAGAIVMSGKNKEKQTFNKEELKDFCLFKTAYTIEPDPKGANIGCVARAVKKRLAGSDANDNPEECKNEFTFRFVGDKADKADLNNNTFYTKVEMGANNKPVLAKGSVTLDKPYWFAYKKTDSDTGAEVTVTYRPRVSIDTFPSFVLVNDTDEHFDDHFTVKSNQAVIPEGKARTLLYNEKISVLIDMSANEIKVDEEAMDKELIELVQKVKNIRKEAASEASNALTDALN